MNLSNKKAVSVYVELLRYLLPIWDVEIVGLFEKVKVEIHDFAAFLDLI